MGSKSRKEERQKERQATRDQRVKQAQKQARARKLRNILSSLAIFLVVAVAVYGVYAWTFREMPGESVPSQGNRHVQAGAEELFPYNTDPPTSGPHYGTTARWGIHKKPIPKGFQTHNLEDGGVVVQYRCQDCPELIEKIEKIVARYPKYVIAAPYPSMKPLIALTAWTRIDRLDAFDEERIVKFIEAYKAVDHHRR